jgi:hypothetical protein
MKFRKYTKEQFISAISTSRSIREALSKLNVEPYGGNYDVARRYIKKLNLNTSHMTRQSWRKGRKFQPKRQIEDYLNNLYPIQTNMLRKRLLREGYLNHMCSCCSLSDWLNKPIPLEIHHINGNNKDNILSNLQLLCPNCHAFTTNYRGKNKCKSPT